MKTLATITAWTPSTPPVSKPSMATGPIPENSNPTASPPTSLSPF